MKITAAAISTAILGLLPLSQVSGLSLHKSSSSEAQIIINGVLRDFSNEDLSIIGQSAIGAYNSVYRKNGFTLESAKSLLHFGVPDSVGCDGCHGESKALLMAVGTVCDGCTGNAAPMAEVGSTCDGCEENIAPMVKIDSTCDGCDEQIMVPMVKVGSTCDGCERAHEAFVTNFCERLAESGSANLANAHHCSFSFLGHKSTPIEVESRNAQAFLSVNGLVHDLTKQDLAIIDASAMEAYNDVFSNTESLLSLKTRVGIDVPSVDSMCDGCARTMCDGCARATCDGCAPEGMTFLADVQVGSTCDGCVSNFKSLVGVGAACDGCSDDLKYATIVMTHLFCAKLRDSGSFNLANANGCGMKFAHA